MDGQTDEIDGWMRMMEKGIHIGVMDEIDGSMM